MQKSGNQVNYLPETNIDPEKQWLEDEMSFGDGLFSGAFQHFLAKPRGHRTGEVF